MGKRKSVYKVRREAAECLPSPNETVPAITVEIKAFFPPYMGHEPRVIQVLGELASEAANELLVEWVNDAQD